MSDLDDKDFAIRAPYLQEIERLRGEIAMLREALDSRKIIGFKNGYEIAPNKVYSDSQPVFTIDMSLIAKTTIRAQQCLAT